MEDVSAASLYQRRLELFTASDDQRLQDWRVFIDQKADTLFAEVVELRRYLHSHPELSGTEWQTASHLQQWLRERNVACKPVADNRGLIVDLQQGSPPDHREPGGGVARFGLRADTDALQIHDVKHVEYRSTVPNVMHACGHDVHSSILAGSLVILNQLVESDLLAAAALTRPFAVRGLFQPAEEICVGASTMIAAGAIDSLEAILAFHVDPFREVGRIAYRSGVMSASCDELIVAICGKGGHAARPHHTRDPITAAAQFLNAVHVQIPRGADSLDTVVVGFGSIHGGEQCNVIPDLVQLRGTLRALTPHTRAQALERLQELAEAIGLASRTRITIKTGVSTPPVINDCRVVELAERVMVDAIGTDNLEHMAQPSMGGEDFAYYLEHIPGALLRLGTCEAGKEPTGLHTPNFDVQEEVMRVGMRCMTRVAVEWFRQSTIVSTADSDVPSA